MTDGFALKSWVIDIINKVTKKTVPKYSTDETVVGTWIDGKPIYRRLYKITSTIMGPSYSWVQIPGADASNADKIINCFASSAGYGLTPYASLLCSINDERTFQIMLLRPNTTEIVSAGASIVVEYTKTTDKATITV